MSKDSRPWPRDTSREAFERRAEALRALGTARRLAAGLALCDEVRDGLLAAAKARRPGLSDEAVRRVVARELLGDELFARAFNGSGAA
jgi:hypothetical protein